MVILLETKALRGFCGFGAILCAVKNLVVAECGNRLPEKVSEKMSGLRGCGLRVF